MLRPMRALVVPCWVAGILVACSHPPPPAPPPAQRTIASWDDVAGSWAAFDDLDFGYVLELAPGDFSMTVNRGKLGTCNVHAKPIQGAQPPKFELEVALDDCHRDRHAGPLFVAFPSFTDSQLVVEITDGSDVTRRTFSRSVQ
jgi:hypothetical protein